MYMNKSSFTQSGLPRARIPPTSPTCRTCVCNVLVKRKQEDTHSDGEIERERVFIGYPITQHGVLL